VARSAVTSPTFVGRHRELAQLAGALAAAADGEATTILVSGSAGLGASRLLTEAQRRLSSLPEPFRVLRGSARPVRSGVPYAPVLDALAPLFLEIPDAELAELAGPSGEELGQLMPWLGTRFERVGLMPARPTIVAPARRQGRILESVLGLLSRLGERRPVVLMLEDLHHADAATRALATFIARISRMQRLCLVATYQPDELTRAHPLRASLEAMAESPRPLQRIGLEPLGRDELAELIEGIEGERASASVLLLVAERSGGNPLVAEALLAARRELPNVSLTGSFEQLVVTRLKMRSDRCRATLRLLATLGRPTTVTELGAIAAASSYDPGFVREEDLAAGLEEARLHGFLAPGPLLDVCHELVGAAIAHDLLPWDTRRHRGALGQALVGVPAETLVHRLAVFDLPGAMAAAVEAADAAEAVDAADVELEHLEVAIELSASLTLGPDDAGDAMKSQRLAELETRAAEAAFASGHSDRATAYVLSAIARLAKPVDRSRLARLHERLGQYRRNAGDSDGGLDELRRAVELAPPDTLLCADALAALAQAEMLDGIFADAEVHARAAIELARRLQPGAGVDGRSIEAHAITTLGVVLGWGDVPDDGVALLREARVLAQETGQLDDVFRVFANLTTVLDLIGRRDDAIAVAYEGIAEARSVGQEAIYGNFLRGNAAETLFRMGRWPEAADLCRTALEWSGSGENYVNAALHLAIVEIEASAGEEASRLLGRLLLELETVRDPQYSVPTYQAAASFALWRSDVADAVRAADLAWDRVAGNGDWVLVARAAATYAEVAAAAQHATPRRRASPLMIRMRARLAEAIVAAEIAVRAAGVAPSVGSRSEAEAWLGTARAYEKRMDRLDAPEMWAELARRWAAVGDRYEVARAHWREAESILANVAKVGDSARSVRTEARPALEAAVALAVDLGARPLLRELDELAGRAMIQVPALLEIRTGKDAAKDAAKDAPRDGGRETPRETRSEDVRESAPSRVVPESGRGLGTNGVRPAGRVSGADPRVADGQRPDRQVADARRGGAPGWDRVRIASPGLPSAGRIPDSSRPAPPPGGRAALEGFVEAAAPHRPDAFGLSPREREVLALIADGHTNREIGTELFISDKTVGVHVGKILAKLDVSGRVEAAAVAIRLGLAGTGRR